MTRDLVEPPRRWKAHSPELYGIARYETGGNPHWRARFQRKGKEHFKRFYDHLEGGTEAALKNAQVWRDSMLDQVEAMTKAELVEIRYKNNTSGNAGVFLVTRYQKREDGTFSKHVCWEARTPHGMKPSRCRSFGIEKYGYDEAYILAVAARWTFVEELEGDHLPRVPEIHRKPRKQPLG
jgi:hypothetical protein